MVEEQETPMLLDLVKRVDETVKHATRAYEAYGRASGPVDTQGPAVPADEWHRARLECNEAWRAYCLAMDALEREVSK